MSNVNCSSEAHRSGQAKGCALAAGYCGQPSSVLCGRSIPTYLHSRRRHLAGILAGTATWCGCSFLLAPHRHCRAHVECKRCPCSCVASAGTAVDILDWCRVHHWYCCQCVLLHIVSCDNTSDLNSTDSSLRSERKLAMLVIYMR